MEEATDADKELAEMFDLAKVKKKKSKTDKKKKEKDSLTDPDASGEIAADDKPTYDYSVLLNRVYESMRESNPEFGKPRERVHIPPPQIVHVPKKSKWTNCLDICKAVGRDMDHVYEYIMSELGTSGSVDGSSCVVIKGRFTAKSLEPVLRKYMTEYVLCRACKSLNTKLERDPDSRLSFVQCNLCSSSRSVAAISSGYRATTRADRKIARAN